MQVAEYGFRRIQLPRTRVNSKDDPTGAWLTTGEKAAKALDKVLGRSCYKAHEGVNSGGANAVFWLDVIQQRPDGNLVVQNILEGAKKKVEQITTVVEPDLVFPLLRGKDVTRWQATPRSHLLMVQDPRERSGIDERALQAERPKTYSYLKRFEQHLRQRAAYRKFFTTKDKKTGEITEKGPFYSMFNVGEYTFAPWRVVWREHASQMTAAVVSAYEGSLTMPDHKLMLVDVTSEEEAHYVCALINCSITRAIVLGYAIGIQMSTHVVERVNLPKYDARNTEHRKLADLGKRAHLIADTNNESALVSVEEDIDELASKIWNVTEVDLEDIRLSLTELQWKPEDKV